MLITALLMAGALTVGDPDEIIATAPMTSVDLAAMAQPVASSVQGAAQAGAPHNLTTDEQIDRWIATWSANDKPYTQDRGASLDDGKPHGEVSVSLGTGGYRDYEAAVSAPLGENGWASFSYRQTKNGYPYEGHGYAYDPIHANGAFDDSGYVFPGYRPAADFENRMMRPDGPPNR